MPVAATDLVIYGSANMPENDVDSAGGAISTSKRVVFGSATLANTFNQVARVESNNAGDTTQTVTVTGRNTAGSIVSDVIALNGTTPVAGVVTFERILKIVVSAAHAGTVTVRENGGGTTLVAIETGVLEIRRPHYNVAADAAGGAARTFYEKIFAKNNHGTLALLAAQIVETADPEAQITFALEDAQNDVESVANRLTAPTGITGDGFSNAAKNVPGIDLGAGDTIGIWMKLDLPAGDPATKTSYTVGVNGQTT